MLTNKRQNIIGESPLLMDVIDQISGLAPLNKPVLILGERGTGKELVAERLHFLSRRWDQPFIKLNCAAMSESLLESELFGHEAGAFTGASRRHLGRFERADGGTLFLDELATCSLRVQEKLLRVIEYGEFERLGGSETLEVDVRLVAATNEDIARLAAQGRFRADLLDRLAFDVVHLPPLRYRSGDIELLAEHFALSICMELQRPFFAGFSDSARAQLNRYSWPGNIRELKNVVERSIYRSTVIEEPVTEVIIDPFQPPWQKTGSEVVQKEQTATAVSAPLDLPTQIKQQEKSSLLQALQHNHFNQRRTAEQLGLSYHQLRSYLRKHQMLPLKQFLQQLEERAEESIDH
ncbi:phage shock protein operon transcriptional activator [Marinobacterium jannaschii]|uniref:phage shock protein operon transcriptional activator n=1 Tax=Marinobacterium jannaschii TaxID=64970 RepID=UPI000683FAF8|nr:phage shock protein operon transcriptional activator [Marinobacterium jannaschii]